jgi:regulator of sigma E protease
MIGVVLFLLLLGLLVGVHEAGHLLACLACGVRVREVGLGLPPRLGRFGTWRGTTFTFNALPLGGFMLPDGEFDRSQVRGFAAAAARRRVAILAAGPASNLLLAYLLFALAFVLGSPDQVRIVAVEPNSPAEQSGLRAGDVVTQANGRAVRTAEELGRLVTSSLDQPLRLGIMRDGQVRRLTLTPRIGWSPTGRAAGFQSTCEIVRYAPGAALVRASQQIIELVRAVPGTFGSPENAGMRLVGVVGMKRITDRALDNSLDWGEPFPVLFVAASLSLALGMTNLLPLPGLDGGRLMLLAPELWFRLRLSDRLERRLNAAGVIGLLGLMVVLAIRDLADPLL